jgi:hypothetical protein
MPGTVVHMAFAGMLAAALLGTAYDRRALLVVVAVTAIPDLDSFIALVATAGHRTALHNVVVPGIAALVLWVDTARGDRSVVLDRFGHRGVRVAWVALFAYVAAGVGLDFVSGAVNPLYPIHDQFYTLDGKIELSDQRGIIQTFVETNPDSGGVPQPQNFGSSQEVNLSTGVDPDPDGTSTDPDPERIFPIVRSGWQLLVLVVGTAVSIARLRISQDLPE